MQRCQGPLASAQAVRMPCIKPMAAQQLRQDSKLWRCLPHCSTIKPTCSWHISMTQPALPQADKAAAACCRQGTQQHWNMGSRSWPAAEQPLSRLLRLLQAVRQTWSSRCA